MAGKPTLIGAVVPRVGHTSVVVVLVEGTVGVVVALVVELDEVLVAALVAGARDVDVVAAVPSGADADPITVVATVLDGLTTSDPVETAVVVVADEVALVGLVTTDGPVDEHAAATSRRAAAETTVKRRMPHCARIVARAGITLR